MSHSLTIGEESALDMWSRGYPLTALSMLDTDEDDVMIRFMTRVVGVSRDYATDFLYRFMSNKRAGFYA